MGMRTRLLLLVVVIAAACTWLLGVWDAWLPGLLPSPPRDRAAPPAAMDGTSLASPDADAAARPAVVPAADEASTRRAVADTAAAPTRRVRVVQRADQTP